MPFCQKNLIHFAFIVKKVMSVVFFTNFAKHTKKHFRD